VRGVKNKAHAINFVHNSHYTLDISCVPLAILAPNGMHAPFAVS
jgi:hypothetical protein